jgi:hypothetical protein
VPEQHSSTVQGATLPGRPESQAYDLPFSRVVYIEATDFRLQDSKDYYGLAPGKSAMLRYAFSVIFPKPLFSGSFVVLFVLWKVGLGGCFVVYIEATDFRPQDSKDYYWHLARAPCSGGCGKCPALCCVWCGVVSHGRVPVPVLTGVGSAVLHTEAGLHILLIAYFSAERPLHRCSAMPLPNHTSHPPAGTPMPSLSQATAPHTPSSYC